MNRTANETRFGEVHGSATATSQSSESETKMTTKPQRKTKEMWRRIREYVGEYHWKNGFGPTLRDIKEEIGLSSASNAKYHVDRMLEAGELTGSLRKARTLNVPNWRETSSVLPSINFVKVPMLGPIGAATDFVLPDAATADMADDLDLLDVPEQMIGAADKVYALEVRGDSMIDALVSDGDTVLIQATRSVRRGDTVAARISRNGEFETTTLKRYYPHREGKIRLQPAHPEMDDIIVDAEDCDIQGKAIAVLRQY